MNHKAMKCSVLLVVILAGIGIIRAVPSLDDNWTHSDSEEGDANQSEAEGSADYHELKWVTYSRDRTVRVASSDKLHDLENYIARQYTLAEARKRLQFVTRGTKQMEDGPSRVDGTKHYPSFEDISNTTPEVLGQSLEKVAKTHFYPEYAIGTLENGCTAFMIGPHHALTAARCVYNYNDSIWSRNLDFWRGKNFDEYIQWLEWSQVVIPLDYFISETPGKNWALITFREDSESPVWLRISYSNDILNIPLTLYGYLQDQPWGIMYSSVCHGDDPQPDSKCLAIQCGTDQKFSGGPILKGYNLKNPPVYGISVGQQHSATCPALHIDSDLFWSLCWIMFKDGFDAGCSGSK